LQLAELSAGICGIPHLPKAGRYGAPGVSLRLGASTEGTDEKSGLGSTALIFFEAFYAWELHAKASV
jgi:hypothetical protein